MEAPGRRRLAAILAADVVAYSRLVAEDEDGTLRTLAAYRAAIVDLVREHGGRIFGTAGDSVIVEFASAVQSVRAAVAIQRALQRHNADLPPTKRLEYRIGINVGDVIAEGDDLLGDGVNVAARLQEVASPAGICISGAVREQTEGKLEFHFASLGKRALKNIPRQVAVYNVDWSPEAVSADMLGDSLLALPDKPSIAVLPFVNMSDDREQEYFADGVTEDIITALSRYRWFFVIARNSTFAYKGRALDVKQIARELGVRYVLEGSVRKAGDRIRATAQLIEAETGNHIWAERFDRELTDIFAVQDEITQSVVAAIEPELQATEGKRAVRKSVSANLDSFDCCMRGVWHFNQFTREDQQLAEAWLRKSIQLDGKFSQAHMVLARLLCTRIFWGWSENIDQDLAEGSRAAATSSVLDELDPYCHYVLFLYRVINRRHQEALAEAQRSLDLTPNFALGYFALGWIRIYLGNFAEALDPILRSNRLNPNDPQSGAHLAIAGLSHYHRHDYEMALRYAQLGTRRRRHPMVLRTLLASLGQLGRIDEAQEVLREIEESGTVGQTRYWDITNPYVDTEHYDHLREGWMKAGLRV
jgi:TolB-like protein/class 3 adenylate cyclase/Tfp pilus assembly protein PilF